MNILVTGASGFLGGRLSKYLAKSEKYTVIATSRSANRQTEFEAAGVTFYAGNPRQRDFIFPLLKNADAIVHCAALSSPWGKQSEFYAANYVLSQTLLDWCKEASVKRFVNIATPSIYFNFKDRMGIKESDPLPKKLVNHYAETKLAAENYILSEHRKGIKTISLRPRAIIGAEDTVLFPRLMRAYEEGKLRIIGNGKNIADFTSVRNLIEAIICALNASDSALGETYNITDGQPMPMWTTINKLLQRLGREPLSKRVPYGIVSAYAQFAEWKSKVSSGKEPALVHYGVASLAKSVTLDISKAKQLLKYNPIVTTEETLEAFAQWYEKN